MLTAVERKLKAARLTGVADAARVLLNDKSGEMTLAFQAIMLRYPEAVNYLMVGNHPTDAVPMPQHREPLYEYRDGALYYWRPGNYGMADSITLIEPEKHYHGRTLRFG